jgi:chromate reductase, NAD(P)H dehydrogenase (quinone)
MSSISVLAFTGSMRKESHNRRLLQIGIERLRELGASVTEVQLRDLKLPMFDEDMETELKNAGKPMPEPVVKLQELMLSHDAFLIASPEYNSSITPALKNAIDWCSRRSDDKGGLACYRGKLAGLMAASEGKLGGVRVLPEVRRILSNIGVHVVPGDFACAGVDKAVPASGEAADWAAGGVKRLAETLFHTTSAVKQHNR